MKFLLLCFLLSLPLSARSLVVLSFGKDNALKTFELDEENAELTPLQTIAIEGSPGALCLSPDQNHLYLSLKKSGEIATFQLDEKGQFTLLGKTPVGGGAAYLQVHPSGDYLLSAYYREGKIAVHRIGENGELEKTPLYFEETDERAHAIISDPSGAFVYVPHTSPNSIHQFKFDPTGGLTANEPAVLQREEKSGPRHLWFHPNGRFVYGSDEQGRSATVYQFQVEKGTLTPVQTVASPAPEGFEGKHNTSDIEVHPSGKFAYLANRGYDVLASFAIDAETGHLTPLAHTPSESVTRSFNISSDGRFLIAAGQNTGKVAVFTINEKGALTRESTLQVGENPWWLEIVTL